MDILTKELPGVVLPNVNLDNDEDVDSLYEFCRDRVLQHPNWNMVAGRVRMYSIQKRAPKTFSESVREQQKRDLLNDKYYSFVIAHADKLDVMINHDADWKFNDFAMGTLIHSYLFKVSVKTNKRDADGNIVWKKWFLETPQYMYMRVAVFIKYVVQGGDLQAVQRMYEDQSHGYYTHASPTLFNAGRKRHQLSSCFLSSTEDKLPSIEGSWVSTAEISRNSGGIGISYSSLRHSEISQQGVSGGLVRWVKIVTDILNAVDQGGLRKGSGAIYIEPWHIDVVAFLDLRKSTGADELRARDIFTALWIPDLFMKRVKEDGYWTLLCPNIALKDTGVDLTKVWGAEFERAYERCEELDLRNSKRIKARELWSHILISQIENGAPYMVYKDACNRKSNQRNLGTIKCSNLCVSGDTMILTDMGYIRIDTLRNKVVSVWNGEEFSEATVCQTGVNQSLVQVVCSNGMTLKCTPYHKFHTLDGRIVEAGNLSVGTSLAQCDFPVIESGSEDFRYPYTHGQFCGDERVSHCVYLLPKFDVPLEADLRTRLEWLSGLIDKDGVVVLDELHISSPNVEFLYQVALMLQTMGCTPDILNSVTTEDDPISIVIVESGDLRRLVSMGFSPRRLKIVFRESHRRRPHWVNIVSVTPISGLHDTYCFNEPKRHMGVFNGILTGNCSEVVQYSSEEEIASCNLASVCLNSCVLDSKLKGGKYFSLPTLIKITGQLVRNLNNVIDRNYYPERVPEIRYSNFRSRPIGIGMQGLADVFAMLDLTWDSPEARQLNWDIAEAMYYGAVRESIEMAKEFGHYDTFPGSPASKGLFQFDLWDMEEEEKRTGVSCDMSTFLSLQGVKRTTLNPAYKWDVLRSDMIEFGLRNSLLIANMPTASTASILNNNEAFEPFTATNYARTVLGGQFVITNKHMVADLEEVDWWNTVVVVSMLKKQGSIQHIPLPSETMSQAELKVLTESEREVLKLRDDRVKYLKRKYLNVFELSQKLLSDFNLDRGRFVCHSQSFNCWMKEPTATRLSTFHFYNWERGAKTGMYYLRQTAKVDPINYALNDFNIPVQKHVVDVEALKRRQEECVSCSS